MIATPRPDVATLADLIGRPFVRGARGPDAFDCWGLVLEVRRRLGLALPPDYATAELARLEALALFRHTRPAGWARCPLREGAVLLAPATLHAGVIVGARVLHTRAESGAVCCTFGHWSAIVGPVECWEVA